MTWTAAGSWLGGTIGMTGTVATDNQAIGNLVIVEIMSFGYNTSWPVSLAGGGCYWTCVAVQPGVSTQATASVFFGQVTATGPGAATVGWSGTVPQAGNAGYAGQEFNSSLGYWNLTAIGYLDSFYGTAAWPALTGTDPAEDLYFGYAYDSVSNATAGTSTGYVYNADIDGLGNGAAYKLVCPAGGSHPVWGDAYQQFGTMVRVTDPGPPAGGIAATQPGSSVWRRRYRRPQQAPPAALPPPGAPAPFTYRATPAAFQDTGTITKQAGTVAGDLALLFVLDWGTGGTATLAAAGFTSAGTAAGACDVALLTRVCDGTEGTSFTVTTTSGSTASLQTVIVTVAGGGLAAAVSVYASPSAATSIPVPGVTVPGPSTWAIWMGITPGTVTPPAGYTPRLAVAYGEAADNQSPAIGPTGTVTGTCPSSYTGGALVIVSQPIPATVTAAAPPAAAASVPVPQVTTGPSPAVLATGTGFPVALISPGPAAAAAGTAFTVPAVNTVTPATVTAIVTVMMPSVTVGGSAMFTVPSATAAVTVPAATATGAATASPVKVAVASAFPAAAIVPGPAVLAVTALFPAARVAPGPVTLWATTFLPPPGLSGSDLATPPAVTAAAAIPPPAVTDQTDYVLSFY